MPPSRAFDDHVVLDELGLHVNGNTLDVGCATLVARRIAIGQGEAMVEGPATTDDVKAWRAEPPLPGTGFTTGRASAVGVETYVVADGVSTGVPLLLTFSWTSAIEIIDAPVEKLPQP